MPEDSDKCSNCNELVDYGIWITTGTIPELWCIQCYEKREEEKKNKTQEK